MDFRAHNLFSAIILLSSSYKLLDAAMLLRPTAYVKKPLSLNKYKSRVQFVMNEYMSLNGFFSFKQKQRLERIPCSEIEYFESNQRTVTVYLRNGKQYTFQAKLDDIQSKVAGINFVRCHQSYLVNMENVRQLDKVNKRFEMVSGDNVDISRRNMSEVQEVFESFISDRG
jgi:DNA-binding LytR/AlgR family response regulator